MSFAYRAARRTSRLRLARATCQRAVESGASSSAARARVAATTSDVRRRRTTAVARARGDRAAVEPAMTRRRPSARTRPCLQGGGVDECEFEHWTRVGGARQGRGAARADPACSRARASSSRCRARRARAARRPPRATSSSSSRAPLCRGRPRQRREPAVRRDARRRGPARSGWRPRTWSGVARFELGQLHGAGGGRPVLPGGARGPDLTTPRRGSRAAYWR